MRKIVRCATPGLAGTGTSPTDSTQAGATCGVLFAAAFCRKSSHALPTAAASLRRASRWARPPPNASCARARDANRTSDAKTKARRNIGADVISVRAHLQAGRHLKHRGEDAVDDKAHHDRDDRDDDRRNER